MPSLSSPFRFAPTGVLFLFLTLPLRAAAPPSLDGAWNDTAALAVEEAHGAFEKAEQGGRNDPREVKFGLASTLLNVQPKTQSNVVKAQGLLQEIIQGNADDSWGILARYFLARIEEIHLIPPNPIHAEQMYRDLVRDHPESALAQLAVNKIAVLNLFINDSPLSLEDRYDALDKLGTAMTDPLAMTLFDYVMGNAALQLQLKNGERRALTHFEAADKLGVPPGPSEARMLVQMTLLYNDLGDRPHAIACAERFVQGYPRDDRNFALRQELSHWKGATP